MGTLIRRTYFGNNKMADIREAPALPSAVPINGRYRETSKQGQEPYQERMPRKGGFAGGALPYLPLPWPRPGRLIDAYEPGGRVLVTA